MGTEVGETSVECCATVVTVTAEVIAVTFRSDHLDAGGKKLIKKPVVDHLIIYEKVDPSIREDFNPKSPNEVGTPFESMFSNLHKEFKKPEWTIARGGSADSHPISHTKNQKVKLDVKIRITVNPKKESATLVSVKGELISPEATLTFTKEGINKRIKGTQEVLLKGLESEETLPNFVTLIENQVISWTAQVLTDAEAPVNAGVSGPHAIYVTFDKPHGKMACPLDNLFTESGREQWVTEPRLRWAVEASEGVGVNDEKECVDAVFKRLFHFNVGYVLGHRWENGKKNNTWVISTTDRSIPKPSLHHYLWLCNSNIAKAECHNIAASMALACRILGVQGAFEVGYMYPWPSRSESPPDFPKRGDGVMGKYNVRYQRSHGLALPAPLVGIHGNEFLVFIDHAGAANNFEGVAKYKEKSLYAIGDALFDAFGTADENATSYYSERRSRRFPKPADFDLTKGLFNLWFVDKMSCDNPYPDIGARPFEFDDPNGPGPDPANPRKITVSAGYFRWDEPPLR